MPNKRFNKQVPAFKAGGRAGKMGGGMMMDRAMYSNGGNVSKKGFVAKGCGAILKGKEKRTRMV